MKILITGGTGFIGSHLIYELLKLNHQIILLKRTVSDTWRINNSLKKITIYNIDKLINFDEIFNDHKIDIIIHLSGKYLKRHPTTTEIKEMNYYNIIIPAQLLDVASKFGVQGFINTGTFFEYNLENTKSINEKSKVNPYNYYTATKLAFEQILKYYCYSGKIKGITLKLFSPYGERDNEKVIPLIIKSFIKNQKLFLTRGDQKLSFTYISDVIDAYIRAMNFIVKNDFIYENFNIGSNQSHSVKEVVKIIQKISSKKNNIEFGVINNPKDKSINIRCDYAKAKKILSWEPKINLKTGLKKTYDYYKKSLL